MAFYLNDITLPVIKCKKPKFSHSKGATWDSGTIKIDGNEYDAYLDTSWGQYIYFQFGELNQWYKLKMQSTIVQDLKGKKYDVDPFARPRVEIKTY